MKKFAAAALIMLFGVLSLGQSQKSITLQWDPIAPESAPVAQVTEVRLYDISSPAAPVLLGTAPCIASPWSCPTTLSLTVQKRRYDIIARSYNGEWESADSNVVIQPGPPKNPGNLRKP